MSTGAKAFTETIRKYCWNKQTHKIIHKQVL